MKTTKRSSKRHQNRLHVKTTLGDLLAATFEVTGGRAQQTAKLLTRGELGRLVVGRHLQFV